MYNTTPGQYAHHKKIYFTIPHCTAPNCKTRNQTIPFPAMMPHHSTMCKGVQCALSNQMYELCWVQCAVCHWLQCSIIRAQWYRRRWPASQDPHHHHLHLSHPTAVDHKAVSTYFCRDEFRGARRGWVGGIMMLWHDCFLKSLHSQRCTATTLLRLIQLHLFRWR